MDIATISSLVGVFITAAPIIGTLAIALLGLIVWWRTGSSIPIFARLWNLFYGTSSATAPAVAEYLEAQAGVMRLRFETGATIRTLEHAKRLIDWSQQHDESLADAAACGPCFNFETPGLNEKLVPSKAKMLSAFTIAFFLILITLGAGIATIPERALLRLNATGTWFLADQSSYKPFRSAPGFKLDQCNADYNSIAEKGGFTRTEITLLCDAYKSEKREKHIEYLDRAIAEQRKALAFVAGYCALLALPTLVILRYGGNARAMRRRLREKAEQHKTRNVDATPEEIMRSD